MPQRVKGHKMDAHLISRQKWELRYICNRFKISEDLLLGILKVTGRSRKKTYNKIKEFK